MAVKKYNEGRVDYDEKELLISSEGIVATCEENRKEHVVLSVVANKIHVYGDFKPLPTPVPTFHLSLDGSADREAEQGADGGADAAADGGAEWR